MDNITGEVTLSLKSYEAIKEMVQELKKTNTRLEGKVSRMLRDTKDLSSFLTFLSKKVDGFQELVNAFNQESTTCEIQKTDDNKYKIKLLVDEDEKSINKD